MPDSAIVAGCAVIMLVLGIIGIQQSLFGDELFTFEMSTRSGLSQVIDGVRGPLEISPPLFFVLAWATGKLGDATVWLRIPSLAAAVAAVPLIYAVGCRTVGRRAGIVGAALLAISPSMVFFATEARAYSLMMGLALASTWALTKAVEGGERRWWLLYAVAGAAALYAHYVAVFVLAAQASWGLWAHPRARRAVAAANAAMQPPHICILVRAASMRRCGPPSTSTRTSPRC